MYDALFIERDARNYLRFYNVDACRESKMTEVEKGEKKFESSNIVSNRFESSNERGRRGEMRKKQTRGLSYYAIRARNRTV